MNELEGILWDFRGFCLRGEIAPPDFLKRMESALVSELEKSPESVLTLLVKIDLAGLVKPGEA